MRTLALALFLTATACAPPGGLDDGNGIGAVSDPAGEAGLEVTNEMAGEGADLLPPSQMSVLTGRCARSSWVSGPLALGGTRRRLGCDMMSVAYLERRPGYTDSAVSVLQKDETARFELGTVWESTERLGIRTVKLGDGEAVPVRGDCKGVFVRPPDRFFESGGMETEHDDDDADDEAQKRETIDCTVSDLQGNVIGAISFSTR